MKYEYANQSPDYGLCCSVDWCFSAFYPLEAKWEWILCQHRRDEAHEECDCKNWRIGSTAAYKFPAAAERYEKNKTDWYWTNNQKFSDNNWNVENTVLGALQDYCQLFDFYIDRNSVKNALDQILKLFPKNVIFLNYLSYYYSSAKEYDKSIDVLLTAYKIDSDDYVIVGNLASDYEKIENYKEAEKWYLIMSKMNSDEAKAYASKGLERIRNKK